MIVFQDERTDGEAGVQVPLLPVSGSGGPAEPHVRLRPVRLQPGARRAVPRMDAGPEAGHVRGDVPDAHRVESRPGDGMAVRGVQRRTPAGPPAPPERLRELLGETGQVSDVQVQAQVPCVGDVHHVGIQLAEWPAEAGKDGRAAGYPLVPSATGRCGTVDGYGEPGRGRTLAHLNPGRVPGRDTAAIGPGGRD